MSRILLRFLLKFLAFSAVIAAAGYFMLVSSFEPLVVQAGVFNFLFFSIFTLLSYPLLAYYLHSHPKKFMAGMMGSIFVKLALSLIYILFIFNRFEPVLVAFVITFFLTYVLFTGFELYLLLINLRQISRGGKSETT